MKRARNDNGIGPSSNKRPANAPEEGSGPAHSNPTSQPQTTGSALAYLKAVKDTLKDQHGKYDEFLEVMRDFKAQRINTTGVIARVRELFKWHRELIPGFNAFLPTGYEITMPPEEEPRKPEFDQAKSYVSKVKTRFQHNEQVYKGFLEILYMYRKGNKSINDVYQEVAALFISEPDLLQEFTVFLPDHGSFARPFQRPRGTSVPSVEKPVAKLMANTSTDCDHQSIESGLQPSNDQKKRLKEKTEWAKDQGNGTDEPHQQLHKHKSVSKPDMSVRGQLQNGIREGFENETATGDTRIPKIFQKRVIFLDKVKNQLQNQEYQEFIKCLNLYNEEIISRTELQKLINDLLGKHVDLIEGFYNFLAFCESNELDDGIHRVKPQKDDKVKKGTGEADRDKDNVVLHVSRDVPTHRTVVSNKDKFMTKPISELDLSNCEQCTPSYRLLPINYPNPTVSHRTTLADFVLNDEWVSVTSGREDYSFKHMRKNQYEESLFRCEDDRFELDMLLESTAVTIKYMEALLEKLHFANLSHIRLEDHLTALNLRCVERIYGDHGLEIVDLLKKNVAVVLPVILNRLKLKHEEWLKVRTDMNKIWAEVYAKNYHKSLDHPKQQDKKSLSTKALLAEIKEINEKKKKDDDFSLYMVVGSKRPLIPDLKYEYPDTSIYDDLYKIVKYSADEMCSSLEQSCAIMQLWTAFIELFFGVPGRPHGTEDAEEVVKGRTTKTKENGIGNQQNDGNVMNCKNTAKRHSRMRHATTELTSNGPVNIPAKANTGRLQISLSSKAIELGSSDNRRDVMSLPLLKEQYDLGLTSYVRHMPKVFQGENEGGQFEDRASRMSEPLLEGSKDARIYSSREDNKVLQPEVGLLAILPEREEGELSPSPEVEESSMDGRYLVSLGVNSVSHASENWALENPPEAGYDKEHEGPGVECDHDADDEEESAHKTSEGSENGSDPGEEVSGMEYGDPNDVHGGHQVYDDDDDDDVEQHPRRECEGEVEVTMDLHGGEGSEASLISWNGAFPSCTPLAVHGLSVANNSTSNKSNSIFYGNDTVYVLFRLHQTLYDRILSVKSCAKAAECKLRCAKDSTSFDTYERFMRVLYGLLDGSVDNAKFEDDCRELIGSQSYAFLTLDKLIFKLVKQLQIVALDETSKKLVALYFYERSRPHGGFIDVVYHANVCTILHDDNIYRFEQYMNPSQLTIQLMEGGPEKLEVATNLTECRFLNYLNGFLMAVNGIRGRPPVFSSRKTVIPLEADENEVLIEVMKDVCVTNGLEYKIACSNSKVSYVLDTEDFLHRRRKRKNNIGSSRKRVQKFYRWLSGGIICDMHSSRMQA